MTFQAFPSFARWCFFRAGDFCTVLSLTTYLSVRRWNVQGKERKYWPKIPFDYKTRPRPLVAVKSGISAVWEKKKNSSSSSDSIQDLAPKTKTKKICDFFFSKSLFTCPTAVDGPGPPWGGWHFCCDMRVSGQVQGFYIIKHIRETRKVPKRRNRRLRFQRFL